jgi:hypothetical protein
MRGIMTETITRIMLARRAAAEPRVDETADRPAPEGA